MGFSTAFVGCNVLVSLSQHARFSKMTGLPLLFLKLSHKVSGTLCNTFPRGICMALALQAAVRWVQVACSAGPGLALEGLPPPPPPPPQQPNGPRTERTRRHPWIKRCRDAPCAASIPQVQPCSKPENSVGELARFGFIAMAQPPFLSNLKISGMQAR